MLVSKILDQYRSLARSNTLWNRDLRVALRKRRSANDALIDQISRTLQHMLLGDEIWLSRLQGNDPSLTSLVPETGLQNLDEFWYQRIQLDESIEKTLSSFNAFDLQKPICYHDFEGNLQRDPAAICMARMLNHQQHHQWTIACCRQSKTSAPFLRNFEKTTATNCFWNCRHFF